MPAKGPVGTGGSAGPGNSVLQRRVQAVQVGGVGTGEESARRRNWSADQSTLEPTGEEVEPPVATGLEEPHHPRPACLESLQGADSAAFPRSRSQEGMMSLLPVRRGWKGEGDAGAPRPGLKETMPKGDHAR